MFKVFFLFKGRHKVQTIYPTTFFMLLKSRALYVWNHVWRPQTAGTIRAVSSSTPALSLLEKSCCAV